MVVRAALEAYLHDDVQVDIDRQIVEGYERIPQSDEEPAW